MWHTYIERVILAVTISANCRLSSYQHHISGSSLGRTAKAGYGLAMTGSVTPRIAKAHHAHYSQLQDLRSPQVALLEPPQ